MLFHLCFDFAGVTLLGRTSRLRARPAICELTIVADRFMAHRTLARPPKETHKSQPHSAGCGHISTARRSARIALSAAGPGTFHRALPALGERARIARANPRALSLLRCPTESPPDDFLRARRAFMSAVARAVRPQLGGGQRADCACDDERVCGRRREKWRESVRVRAGALANTALLFSARIGDRLAEKLDEARKQR